MRKCRYGYDCMYDTHNIRNSDNEQTWIWLILFADNDKTWVSLRMFTENKKA